MTVFCAICVATIHGTPFREPLGRDGAMVNVCRSCATEPPRAHDRELAYDPSGLPTGAEATAGAIKAMGLMEYQRRARDAERYSRSIKPKPSRGEQVTDEYFRIKAARFRHRSGS